MRTSKLVEKVIVAWFVIYLLERAPRVIALLRIPRLRRYHQRMEAAQEKLGKQLEEAKYTAEMDWEMADYGVAKAFIDQEIERQLGEHVPDTERERAYADNLPDIKDVYTLFVATIIIQPDALAMEDEFMSLSRGMRANIQGLRAARLEQLQFLRKNLQHCGFDTVAIEAKYTPQPAA